MDDFEKILGNVTRNAGVAVKRYVEENGGSGGLSANIFDTQYTNRTDISESTTISRTDYSAPVKTDSTYLDDDAMSIRGNGTIRWPPTQRSPLQNNNIRNNHQKHNQSSSSVHDGRTDASKNQSYGDLIDVPTREVSQDSLVLAALRVHSSDSLATGYAASRMSATVASTLERNVHGRPLVAPDSASSLKSSFTVIEPYGGSEPATGGSFAAGPAPPSALPAVPGLRDACPKCRKQATQDNSFEFNNERWHPECIACEGCGKSLNGVPMYIQEGKLWCEADFDTKYGKKCSGCNGVLKDKCLTAMGKYWHPDHFVCTKCNCSFADGSFMERDGKPYCKKDFLNLFCKKCNGCGLPIEGIQLNACNHNWHTTCFRCKGCGKTFNDGQFYEKEGTPFCDKCFAAH